MTPERASELLECPDNRLDHLGASLFVAGTNPPDWFDEHPEYLEHVGKIRRGYQAACVLRHDGGLPV